MKFLFVGLIVSLGFVAVSCDQHSWEDEKDEHGNITYKGTKRFYTEHHGDSHDASHDSGHGDDHKSGHADESNHGSHDSSHDEGHKNDDKGHH